MEERFKIFTEQLRHGRVEHIKELYDTAFLAINEPELQFKPPVSVEGEAYVADENLIVHLQVSAKAIMPCVICLEPAEVLVEVPNLYHIVPLDDVKNGIFSLQDVLREAILLELPKFVECHAGNCPSRKSIQKYLKKGESSTDSPDELDGEGYRPFADIDFDIKPKT